MKAVAPALLLGVSLLAGCAGPQRQQAAPVAASAAPVPVAQPLGAGLWPVDMQRYRTTAGPIYLHNLDARIDTLQARVDEAGLAEDREKLVAALWHRFRVLGHLRDAERALAEVSAPEPYLGASARGSFLRAVVLVGFHRFREAEDALQQAQQLGHDAQEIARQRADLLTALGRYDALAEDLRLSAQPVGDFDALAHRADLRVLLGDLAGAERQYWAAQSLYRDVNPVPLAWLHTQMGIALLRFGHIERAAEFFGAAVERLPGYYLAEEHLAECEFLLGKLDASRQRYLQVIERSGQPEFMAALAEVEAARGDAAAAAEWKRRADAKFRALVERHGLAFAQHAAEFFLEEGDIATARRLATDNLELRQDAGSWMLAAEVALAEGQPKSACGALSRVRAAGLSPPELADIEARGGRCEGAISPAQPTSG